MKFHDRETMMKFRSSCEAGPSGRRRRIFAGDRSPGPAQRSGTCRAAYPANNPHTENLAAFAKEVEQATGGKLQITRASGGVAVQGAGDQARGADRAGADGRGSDLEPRERGPGLRHRRHSVPRRQLRRGEEAVGRDAPRHREEARRARHHGADGGAVGAAGHLRQEGHQLGRGHEGPALARLQRRHFAHRRTGRRAAGDDPGGRAAAGARDRRRQRVHDLGLDRLRQQGLGDA